MDGERNRVSGGLAHYSRTTQTQAVIYVICAACATVAFAAEHSAAPPDPPTARHIDRLIRALGDGDYFVRQKAEADLGKMGFDAVDALTAAADSDDMEVAIRVARLLFSIRSNWASPGDPSDVVSLLARYETQDDNVREFRVGQLLELPHAAGIPAICRIIRFERSLPLAKLAALRLVESISKGGDAKKTSAAVIERTLGDCSRRPARWVVAWLRAKQDSTALATLWTDLLASEEELLLQQPRETSLDVVEQLLRMQIAALRKISRGADAQASLAAPDPTPPRRPWRTGSVAAMVHRPEELGGDNAYGSPPPTDHRRVSRFALPAGRGRPLRGDAPAAALWRSGP